MKLNNTKMFLSYTIFSITEYAEEALKLATCDGPPYYYKVAYEEAERMLERLKEEG